MTQAAPDTTRFGWLLANFARETDGVTDAVAVSSDGLLMALSAGLDREDAEYLAAIVSAIKSLAKGAADRYDFDGLKLVMIEMRRGFLLVSAISDGSSLGVLATEDCDVGLVGHEMAILCERAGHMLTPLMVTTLKTG